MTRDTRPNTLPNYPWKQTPTFLRRCGKSRTRYEQAFSHVVQLCSERTFSLSLPVVGEVDKHIDFSRSASAKNQLSRA